MARRRSRTSATGGNMDSMLDTLTNVVGILVIVLVTVQLSSQEAASRIAAAIAQIDPEEVKRLEREAEEAKEAAEAAEAQLDAQREARNRDPAKEILRLEAEANTSEAAARAAATKADELVKRKTAESAAAKKAAEEAARKAAEAKAAAERALADVERRRAALAAELDKTQKPVAPPAKEVRLPDPRPAPDKAKELRVLCREGRVWLVEIEELQEQAQKRAAYVVRQKKLDPDNDNWLTDGKVFAEEFNKAPVREAGFDMTVLAPDRWPKLVLARKPGSGQTAEDAVKATGELAKALRKYKPADRFVRFYVWPDGFEAYLAARQLTGERGFAAGWEPVSSPDEHAISLGKYAIGTKPPPPPADAPKPPPAKPPNLVD